MNEKILKLLTFLKNQNDNSFSYEITENKSKIFTLLSVLSFDDPEYKDRDEQYLTVDFNSNKISWSAYYTSGHNGSSYGGITREVSWDYFTPLLYDKLFKIAKRTVALKLENEQKAKEKDLFSKQAELQLNNLLFDTLDL